MVGDNDKGGVLPKSPSKPAPTPAPQPKPVPGRPGNTFPPAR